MKGTGANLYGQGLNIFIQLLSFPIFLHAWTAEQYGIWLILTAFPAYIAMADFGAVSVVANEMTSLAAQNRWKDAQRIFQNGLLIVAAASIITLFIVCVILLLPGVIIPYATSNTAAVIFLTITAAINIFSGLFEAIYRCSGHYARGIYIISSARLIEWLGAIASLLLLSSIEAVAAGALAGRLIATLLIYLDTRERCPRIHWLLGWTTANELKSTIAPALAFMAFPVGNAINIQGMIIVVGSVLGPMAVTTFTAYRTISRVVVQVVASMSHTLSPEFATLLGKKQYQELSKLYKSAFKAGLGLALIASVFMMLLSPWFLRVWTAGQIGFDFALMLPMVGATLLAGTGHVPRTLLLSTNNHIGLAGSYLLISITAIFVSGLLQHSLQLAGATLTLLLLEMTFLGISLFLAKRMLSMHSAV